MLDPLLIVFLLLLAFLAGLLVGWDWAVHRYRAERRRLAAQIQRLDDSLALFQDEADEDPQRAWLNHGKRSVVNQVETTLHSIRAELE